MKSTRWLVVAAVGAVMLWTAACKDKQQPIAAGETETQQRAAQTERRPGQGAAQQGEQAAGKQQQGEAAATARLQNKEGTDVGTVRFEPRDGKVLVTAQVKNVSPGKHGFHVHEKGECQPPDFKSAGGHFNPTGAKHGGPQAPEHHAGDFGNIEIGADGTGTLSLTSDMITLDEGERSVIGKAVVVHEKVDDLGSQPSGDAGPRVACGVIRK